jgi:hypothetical protein
LFMGNGRSPALTGIASLLFGVKMGDVNCGMRGITKDLYRCLDLRTTGMEFASEFVIKATKMGVRMAEVPITVWPAKRRRPAHLRTFRDGWRHLRFMLSSAPDWLFFLSGMVLFLLGVGLVFWLLPGPHHLGHVVVDLHTMLFGMVLALTGAQIVSMGLFAAVFSFTERFPHGQHSLGGWLKRLRLEIGLLAGAILALAGVSGVARRIPNSLPVRGPIRQRHPVRDDQFCPGLCEGLRNLCLHRLVRSAPKTP